MSNPNIIIFGETGTGKSSVVNMLSDSKLAEESSAAKGCTFESKKYTVTIRGQPYNLWDTAGLNEGEGGTVSHRQAIIKLYELLRSLTDGVNLLMFVMRGPRIKEATKQNWRLFKEIICSNRVPAVIVITGLENEEVLDDWWVRNRAEFDRREICPAGQACIVAIKGKLKGDRHLFQYDYDESKKKVESLIRTASLSLAWKVERAEWFRTILRDVREEYGEALKQLVERCEMSEGEAKALAQSLKNIDDQES
ncbi:hypothetical protein BDN72DRAFT_770781 [Pluteus cervinus]|uniref:Uncharacterized protein n=1 Tax=Pluteus cervinus TaxID=181527 RepID=A0ACD3ANX6_9AGAR|nr:hypothetical protein BDN72DRAFT_770781 [Pluteus cervinus]